VEVLGPGNAITRRQSIAAHVVKHTFANLLDDTDDLVAENAGAGIRPVALVGVDVRAANGAHGYTHQHFAGADITSRTGYSRTSKGAFGFS